MAPKRKRTKRSVATDEQPSLDSLLASREMILVAGSGGVGKTTVAAALGLAAVQRQPGRVLVLTVDPARRLATALGLEALGNAPHAIPNEALEAAGLDPRGELHVAMLDTKAGWDELIRRHAPGCCDAGGRPREPAVREHHESVRAQPRLSRHGAAPRSPCDR